MDAEIFVLSESLVDELVAAFGLPKTAFWHGFFRRISRPVTDRVAALGMAFDRLTASDGLPAASERLLADFCHPVRAHGRENIPLEGPLLVASNHPGAYDALVIFSQLARGDIRWISSEIPFLQKLPHLSNHMLTASRSDTANRMVVMRAAIRHLRAGGALLYFGAGHRDPDPATYLRAGKMMDHWLEGIEFFFRHVPGLRLLPTVVSGVVSAKWARHPISWLRRRQIDRQRLSEFGQVITQLLDPGTFKASPAISFGPSMSEAELRGEGGNVSLLPAVIVREKSLLVEHCRAFGGDPGL